MRTVETQTKTLRVVFFREGDLWLGQCLEHDIVARGRTLQHANEEMQRLFVARIAIADHLGLQNAFDVPAAPSRFWEMYESSSEQDVPLPPARMILRGFSPPAVRARVVAA